MRRDLVGQKFGRLLVIKHSHSTPKNSYWECICDCGNRTVTRSYCLISGGSKSCGCLAREVTIARNTKHGCAKSKMTKETVEYYAWVSMRRRCYKKDVVHFNHYGGRGISVCDRWRGKDGFKNFLEDMGPRPEGTSLDRINNDGNYEPGNCRWATPVEQHNNTRANKWLTLNEETHTMAEWARLLGVKPSLFRDRLRRGWCVEDAISKPVGHRRHHDNSKKV